MEGYRLHSLNGTLCFLWYHCSHSQLLTIYLDVIIVCNIIKEKNMTALCVDASYGKGRLKEWSMVTFGAQ